MSEREAIPTGLSVRIGFYVERIRDTGTGPVFHTNLHTNHGQVFLINLYTNLLC